MTHLAKDKKSNVVVIYKKPEDNETYSKMRNILFREGKSFSSWIWERAREYVRLHEPGNPQQTMDYIIENGRSYHAPPTCKVCHERDASLLVHFEELGRQVEKKCCKNCLSQVRREHKNVGYRKL